jgi:alkylation response protein AidB-like acyl-CoA dehydrogenase
VRETRWVGFSWPEEYGGGGGGIMEQVILKEEMSKAGAPPLGTCMMGLQWVGPAIIQYGTEEQKAKFLPEILDSKYQWCTGYSEPAVGSDLAALQCKGVRDGDDYVINGQKIWTSLAAAAAPTSRRCSSTTSASRSRTAWAKKARVGA